MRKILCLFFVTSITFPLSLYSQLPEVASSSDSLVYSITDFSDSTKRDIQQTTDVDLDTAPPSIVLASGDTKDLALGALFSIHYTGAFPQTSAHTLDTARMNPSKLGDDNLFTIVSLPPGNVGSTVTIDLQAFRRINRIQVAVLGGFGTSLNQRPRAFSYYAGVDSNSLGKIYQELDNQDSIHTAYLSQPVIARYVMFQLDKQTTTDFTVISEIRIYGEGYVSVGTYTSAVDTTLGGKANFGPVYVDADFDNATSVSIEMRTGNTPVVDSTWSVWSPPVEFFSAEEADEGTLLEVKEPRRNFQYRIKLFTSDIGTPKVKGVKFVYQNNLVADSTDAFITPSDVPVLSPATLKYSIAELFSPSSLGVDTIRIRSPGPAVVRSVSLNGTAIPYTFLPAPDQMTITFPQSIATSSTLDITFTTKLIQPASFPAVIISKNAPWNPQYVDPRKTSSGDAWSITTSGVPANVLVGVQISPNPFTPNGDGKNDAAVIDFSIANIETPKTLSIFIFDLTGKKIRTIVSTPTGANPFFGDPRSGGKGFLWDGKDDNGKLVLPGVYIVQLAVNVDNGGQFATKTVVVAY
jgi:hypothetical protein